MLENALLSYSQQEDKTKTVRTRRREKKTHNDEIEKPLNEYVLFLFQWRNDVLDIS